MQLAPFSPLVLGEVSGFAPYSGPYDKGILLFGGLH